MTDSVICVGRKFIRALDPRVWAHDGVGLPPFLAELSTRYHCRDGYKNRFGDLHIVSINSFTTNDWWDHGREDEIDTDYDILFFEFETDEDEDTWLNRVLAKKRQAAPLSTKRAVHL